MKKILFTVAALAFALSSPVSAHDSMLSGAWRLSAKVASVPFHLICKFDQIGDRLGGTCHEPSSVKEMPVVAGRVEGDQVVFAHPAHFLFNKFDVNYKGVVEGDRMNGQIAVFGHTGDFTAVREGD
jgi:hypothetical protein